MIHDTVVGDNINTMKTTFDLNFNLYQAFNSMDTHKLLVNLLFEKSL